MAKMFTKYGVEIPLDDAGNPMPDNPARYTRFYGQAQRPSERSNHMTLSQCHETFQKRIGQLAARCGKTPDDVYKLWREYSDQCTMYDQSALLGEFEEWYKPQLAAPKE